MNKIPTIINTILLVIFGGLFLGVLVSVLLGGPQQPDGLIDNGAVPEREIERVPNVSTAPASPVNPEPSPAPVYSDHPLLGRWDLAATVEVDSQVEEGMATAMEFTADGTGRAHHSDLIVPQDFNWQVESGRLGITPVTPAFGTRTYEYEITDDVLTIFYNTNRTSYAEFIKVR